MGTDKEHPPKRQMSKAENVKRLNRDIQLAIGKGLRSMYDDIVQQGVPERFADLLSKLDQPPAKPSERTKANEPGGS